MAQVLPLFAVLILIMIVASLPANAAIEQQLRLIISADHSSELAVVSHNPQHMISIRGESSEPNLHLLCIFIAS